jgi:hypothetical protein
MGKGGEEKRGKGKHWPRWRRAELVRRSAHCARGPPQPCLGSLAGGSAKLVCVGISHQPSVPIASAIRHPMVTSPDSGTNT